MAIIGYHCSHERFAPSALLRYARLAEEAGFAAGMCSDHFHPWGDDQGHGGFAWSWLGAALQATSLSFGMVNAPGQRYHPAIVAQAAATLAEMFPGRLWCAFGSGEYLNEHITGERWPTKPERNARLKEAADVIRALWNGETVTMRGAYITVEDAKLYSRPERPPLLLAAAIGEETAEWAGGWADGVITVAKPADDQKRFIDAFHRGGGQGKPMFLQSLVSYADTEEQARQDVWTYWRFNLFGSDIAAGLRMPSDFEAVARYTRPEDMDTVARISADLDRHIEWIQQDIDLGFENIYLYNAGNNQEQMIRAFGERVLPALRGAAPAGGAGL